jgi:hypothetical protein
VAATGYGYRATFFHLSFYTARPVPAREKGIRKNISSITPLRSICKDENEPPKRRAKNTALGKRCETETPARACKIK